MLKAPTPSQDQSSVYIDYNSHCPNRSDTIQLSIWHKLLPTPHPDFETGPPETSQHWLATPQESPGHSQADFLAVAEGEVEHADVMAAFLQWDQNGALD